jgi:hypothetical protein
MTRTPPGGYVPAPDEAEEYGLEDEKERREYYEYRRTEAANREARAAEREAEATWRAQRIFEGFVVVLALMFIHDYVDVNVRIP